jgi:hypothetical protein
LGGAEHGKPGVELTDYIRIIRKRWIMITLPTSTKAGRLVL